MSEQAYIDAINELDEVIKMLRAQLAAAQAKGKTEAEERLIEYCVGCCVSDKHLEAMKIYPLVEAVAREIYSAEMRERNPKEKQT